VAGVFIKSNPFSNANHNPTPSITLQFVIETIAGQGMKLGVLAGLLVLMGKHNRFWLIVLYGYHRSRARVS